MVLANCELLCIYREDFKRLLRPIVQKQWDQVSIAMSRFEYFNSWSEEQKEECCVLAKIKQFDTNETVFGERGGFLNFTHFILSGKCMVLQCLKIKVSTTLNIRMFFSVSIEIFIEDGNHKRYKI